LEKQKKSKTKAGKISVQDLIHAFKGTLVSDQDKMGYTNLRYPGSKRIVFYCIDRDFGVTVSVHDDNTKSGYRSEKITSRDDFNAFVASIQAQIDNTSKYANAFTPVYLCPCGQFQTSSKTEMATHVATHQLEQ